LAVLPFDVTGADLPDTGLAVGLFADVSDRLRGSGVETIWPQALYAYRNSDSPFDAVREDLDPDVIWITRLSTLGDSIYVRAEMVDARSLVTLEATSIAAPVEALLTVVPGLVAWASRVLHLEEAEPGYEPDQEARRAYVRARTAWWDFDLERTDSLIAEALKLDPEYPEAWGLYALLELQWTHGNWAPPCSMYAAQLPVVKKAAERALALDSTLIMPRVALGHALWEHEFDWSGAETAFLEALELAPDHPDANVFYGVYLMTAGEPERAWEYVYRAAQANILEPRFQSWAAMLAFWTGTLPEAEEILRVARMRVGADSWATGRLISNLRDQGRLDEALQLLLETGRDTVAEPLDDEVSWAVARGHAEAVDRHISEALDSGDPRWASLIAYWDRRDDEAMQYLEDWWPGQLECPSRGRVWLLADYPRLIDRPRFQEMMDVAGIPWRESEVWSE
jgi:tetratricopeptide (TPR) repeat protein